MPLKKVDRTDSASSQMGAVMTYSSSNVVAVLEDYLRLTGVCPVMFGREVAGDGELVADIRSGIVLPERTARALLDRVIGHLEQLTVLADAQQEGLDLVSRTVLMPVPIAALPAFHKMVEAYS